MRVHSTNELKFKAQILDADSVTVLATARAGIEDLAGRRLEQAQLISAESTHMLVLRFADATALTDSGYVLLDGALYIVDYLQDPRRPRPKTWLEVYAHRIRSNS